MRIGSLNLLFSYFAAISILFFQCLRIGLTGGIGSGKSTVAHIFFVLGIPVYDADSAAKRLMSDDKILKQEIIKNFGEESYRNGQLNTKHLSEQVFRNPQKTDLLNSIVHPATILDAEEWMEETNRTLYYQRSSFDF